MTKRPVNKPPAPKPVSPAGEKREVFIPSGASQFISNKPAVVAPAVVAIDPFAGILPSREELAKFRRQAEQKRLQEFNEKMPHVLKHIAAELRQAASQGEAKATVDLGRFGVWLETHQDGLLAYLKKVGFGYDTVTGKAALVIHLRGAE